MSNSLSYCLINKIRKGSFEICLFESFSQFMSDVEWSLIIIVSGFSYAAVHKSVDCLWIVDFSFVFLLEVRTNAVCFHFS